MTGKTKILKEDEESLDLDNTKKSCYQQISVKGVVFSLLEIEYSSRRFHNGEEFISMKKITISMKSFTVVFWLQCWKQIIKGLFANVLSTVSGHNITFR